MAIVRLIVIPFLSNGTPVGDRLAIFDFSLSVDVFTHLHLPFFFFFPLEYPLNFPLFVSVRALPLPPPLLLYEAVNSLRGGSAVITTVMSGGAEERSPGKRKATVR